MSAGDYIAIDWGATNRRIYRMRVDGSVKSGRADNRGVLTFARADYPEEIAAIRAEHGALPILAAGMVGSTRGWRDTAYCDLPAGLGELAAGAGRMVDVDVLIVPGLAQRGPGDADVMRGEEVQVLGAIAAGMAPADGLFCQPGTHNKWIDVRAGRITGFATAMTGELFALLRSHSILSDMLQAPVCDGPAFRDGVARACEACDLPVSLFGIRAAALLGERDPADAASYASGLLIGADIGTQGDLAGRDVHLLASDVLADLYGAAIGMVGGIVRTIDSHAAFAAGIHGIRELTA